MEEEIKRAVENAIYSAHLRLVHKIIKMAIRDARPLPPTGHHAIGAYAIAIRSGFAEPRDEVWAFFSSEGFLWLLLLIGCEPKDLKRIAGRIALQALGIGGLPHRRGALRGCQQQFEMRLIMEILELEVVG